MGTNRKNQPPIHLLTMAVTLMLSAAVHAQTPLDNHFTYQGQITQNGSPVNGSCDFIFILYDASVSGSQVGSILNAGAVAVSHGVFTVPLDFGAVFNGDRRWLETQARCPAGSGTYATLNPRQELTAAPYAAFAPQAGSAATATHATTATTAVNFSGTLAGAVTGTQGATVLADGSVTDAKITAVSGTKVSGPIPVASVPGGSGNYIQNATSPQSSANFNISGNGTAGGTFAANIVNATTQYSIGGNRVLSIAGTGNLFAGYGAGQANTTGDSNVFIGHEAGVANASGAYNSFVGYRAGYSNTGGHSNVFIGDEAGVVNTTGVYNSFVGHRAGYSNTSGHSNSFVGYRAGRSNTIGDFNSFVGWEAGFSNTEGDVNEFFGYRAGYSNTGGTNNSFFGSLAGQANITGNSNAFFGTGAGYSNNSGSSNAFFGWNAGQANTTGGSNAFLGVAAGNSNITGTNNTIIGANADVASGALTYATAIGAGAVVSTSNTIALGRTDGSDMVVVYGLGSAGSTALCRNASNQIATCSSSARYKSNSTPFTSGLDLIRKLRPVSFHWKEGGMADMGLVAEDVAAVEPLLTTTNATGEIEGVKYDRVSVVLVNAINEQQAQIAAMEARLEGLQRKIEQNAELQQRHTELEARLAALEQMVCAPRARGCQT